jgi:hypothetical protein
MSLKPPGILAARPAAPALAALDAEMLQEKAATLGRLTRAFERALADYLALSASRSEERRERLCSEAAEALWRFVVQREACGLRNTEAVLREYCVPAAVRLRMGTIRRG